MSKKHKKKTFNPNTKHQPINGYCLAESGCYDPHRPPSEIGSLMAMATIASLAGKGSRLSNFVNLLQADTKRNMELNEMEEELRKLTDNRLD